MAVQAFVYVSRVAAGVESVKVDAIVADASAFNRDADLTGVLLYDGARFLQFLEGSEAALASAFERIRASSSHSDIVELGRGVLGQRLFPIWTMRWIPVEAMAFGRVVMANWQGLESAGADRESGVSALESLVGGAPDTPQH